MNGQWGLSPKTLASAREILGRYPQIERAILYGSRAKGNYKTGSDIDLTLVGKGLDVRLLGSVAEAFYESWIPQKFDLSIFELLENPDLRAHIERVGVVFYERQPSDGK
jgi:predicted nucleotidyltransferase